jgi:hypothetical protein
MTNPEPHSESDLHRPGDAAWTDLLARLREPAPVPPPTRDAAAMAAAIVAADAESSPAWPTWLRVAAMGAIVLGAIAATRLVLRPRGVDPVVVAAAGHSAAVANGTRWLISAQSADGSWNPEPWGGHASFTPGLTGLAVIALLSGEKPAPGAEMAVARASQWFAERRPAAGQGGRDLPYNLGLSALAQVEIARYRATPALREQAGAAVRELVRLQQADGGWGYATSGGVGYDNALTAFSNASATTWPLRALHRARALGWPGLDEACARGDRWLASRRGPDGRVGYRLAGDFPFGWETLTAMTDWLVPPAAGAARPGTIIPADRYQGFFVTRTAADQTRLQLVRRLLNEQDEAGHWPVDGDRWKMAGGRLYGTCFALLSLRADPG